MSSQRFFFLLFSHQNSNPLAEVIPCWLLNSSNVTFQLSFFQICFQLKECKSIRIKSKNQNGAIDFRLMQSLKTILNSTRFSQDANGGKCKTSTVLCSYRFKFWDYTQSMEHRKLECLETLTRGSYCSATQQNKPFQFPISYLVFAMIVPLGFKNLRSGLMPRTSFIFPS